MVAPLPRFFQEPFTRGKKSEDKDEILAKEAKLFYQIVLLQLDLERLTTSALLMLLHY